ncbi:MAG: hypothetical protein Q4C73_04075 [Eubacteriales bacterium]|nr:hypothetical protein [Eubacteriales bacterium]
MPYCPKCDMEFVEGITVCSDCGGPLEASKEAAAEKKKKEQEELLAGQQAEFEAMMADGAGEVPAEDSYSSTDPTGSDELRPAAAYGALKSARPPRAHVYVKKSQQYDDLKSSVSAFLLVGGILTLAALACWTGILSIPMAGISGIIMKSLLTVMGLGSLYIAYTSSQSAKKVAAQAAEEEQATAQLIDWFISSYTGEALDQQISSESGDMSPEELSLKRFDLIQDLIITNHDIADQAYVDLLAEEIYGKLYQD